MDATSTDVCFVHVLDDTERSLTLTGATAPFDQYVGKVKLHLGEGVSGWVATHKEPAVIQDDKQGDPRYRYIPELRGTDYTSMASVPMASDHAGLVGVLNVHTAERRTFTDRDIRMLTTIGSLIAGAVHTARLNRRLLVREQTHERFAEQVVAAQEAERRRIAADIHDGISQRLVSLAFHLDSASRTEGVVSNHGAARELSRARQLIDEAQEEARLAIGALRPPVLDDLGLRGALASLSRSLPDVDVRLELDEDRLLEHVEVALYRIAQEAMQNVVKHANAGLVHVRYRCGPDTALLSVVDDGAGFDQQADEDGEGRPGSYGMTTMSERAELVGGRLEVRSAPGRGTSVTVRVPVGPPGSAGGTTVLEDVVRRQAAGPAVPVEHAEGAGEVVLPGVVVAHDPAAQAGAPRGDQPVA